VTTGEAGEERRRLFDAWARHHDPATEEPAGLPSGGDARSLDAVGTGAQAEPGREGLGLAMGIGSLAAGDAWSWGECPFRRRMGASQPGGDETRCGMSTSTPGLSMRRRSPAPESGPMSWTGRGPAAGVSSSSDRGQRRGPGPWCRETHLCGESPARPPGSYLREGPVPLGAHSRCEAGAPGGRMAARAVRPVREPGRSPSRSPVLASTGATSPRG